MSSPGLPRRLTMQRKPQGEAALGPVDSCFFRRARATGPAFASPAAAQHFIVNNNANTMNTSPHSARLAAEGKVN
jgi:hypothetical protein